MSMRVESRHRSQGYKAAESEARCREPSIRALRASDLDKANDIFMRAFGALWSQRGWTLPLEAGRSFLEINHSLDPDAAVVASIGSEMVGFCFAHPRGATAGIGPMAVVPETWATGAAGHMLEALLKRPDMASARSVRLLVSSWNERAIAFYARHGFAARSSIGVFTTQVVPPVATSCESTVRRLRVDEVSRCRDLDYWATGAIRMRDYEFFAMNGAFVACEDAKGHVLAFGGAHPAAYEADGSVAGPVVARDVDSYFRVLRGISELGDPELPSAPLTVRVPLSSTLVTATLLELGARLMNVELLLVRGSWTFDDAALVGLTMLPESN